MNNVLEPSSVSGYVMMHIMEQITPNTELGIIHQGNWPNDAVFGVTYKYFDKQFPEVQQSWSTEYFTSIEGFNEWVKDKQEFVKSTDYDFSIEYRLYEWDLGPNFKNSGSI